MGDSYNTLIAQLETDYDLANQAFSNTVFYLTSAWFDWGAADDHGAIEEILNALAEVVNYQAGIMSFGNWGWPAYGYSLIDALNRSRACPFNGAVDMDAILSAMITADFDQLQKFTGLADAYRVALWNEPFNAEFYAALARGFMP